jgi:hypothetical protein
MKIGKRLPVLVAAAALLAGVSLPARAQQQKDTEAIAIGEKDIGGVVSSPQGREAGVWVIAETTELPTRFRRIVVTDDQGRYLLPDLPQADYSVWVRGYGLVDSPKMRAKPGQRLDLAAASAPSETEAAHYYPAIYWYSLLTIPDKSQFGGENGIPANVSQQDWLTIVKNRACVGCHQLGQESTRTIPAAFSDQKTSEDAWMRRVQSGQSAPFMVNPLAGQLGGAPFKYFADWTDRIAHGGLPHAPPPRPQGMERNLVITEWDWGRPDKYLHDLISSDKREPTINANGKLYASPEYSTDELPILDPVTNTVTSFHAPVRDPGMALSLGDGHAATLEPVMPSAYWGDRQIWDTRVNNHNMMVDRKGRVWLTASVRGLDNPAFCKEGSDHPSAKLFPLKESHRQLAMLDPQTMKYTFVDTCFDTHHLQFGFDKDDTLWTSGGGPVVGWLDTKVFDETGDAAKAQGWTALVLDTDGKRQARRRRRAGPANRSAEGQAPARRVLRDHAELGGRFGVGHRRRVRRQGCSRAARSRPEPACDNARRGLQRPTARLWTARRRHRQQGCGVGIARQRASRQLRPAQVQGSAERTQSHRRSLPGGLDALPVSGTGLSRHRREQRRGELLHLGRSAQYARARERHSDLDRQRKRRAAGAGGGGMGGPARSLPAELLCQGHGRPHRRPQCGMERARGVDDERRSDAVAQGRRQGYRSDRLPFPAAPQPARRLTARAVGPTRKKQKRRKK